MRGGNTNLKHTVLCILAVVLTLVLVLLCVNIITLVKEYVNGPSWADDDTYDYRDNGQGEYCIDGKWYVRKSNIETFLLIGIDKYEAAIKDTSGYRNTQQADALFLLKIDKMQRAYTILHINRDTMLDIAQLDINGRPYNTFFGQVALSHTYGSGREDSCLNTVKAVSEFLFATPIDHYASISMDGVAVLNDAIGGVTLTVSEDMTSADPELIKGKEVTLTGEQALLYVRARAGVGQQTNIERMGRQREYINAYLEQSKKAFEADSSLAVNTVKELSKYLISDYSTNDMVSLSEVLTSYRFEGIKTIDGDAEMGEAHIEFYADDESLKNLLLDLFFDEK